MHADIVYVLLLLINEMNSNVDSSMCMYIHIYIHKHTYMESDHFLPG